MRFSVRDRVLEDLCVRPEPLDGCRWRIGHELASDVPTEKGVEIAEEKKDTLGALLVPS